MTRTAAFSNGSFFETNSKRDYTHAWRVEWVKVDGSTDFAGGWSSSPEGAEKAMAAWCARMTTVPTFREVTGAR